MNRFTSLAVGLLCSANVAFGQTPTPPEVFVFDRVHPSVGTWIGDVSGPGSKSGFAQFRVERNADGTFGVRVTILEFGARNDAATDVVADGRTLSFSFAAKQSVVRIDATVSEDGQKLSAAAKFESDQPGDTESATLDLQRIPHPDSLPSPIAYEGKAKHPAGLSIDMAIVLARTPGGNWVGYLDIPMLKLREYPLIEIERLGRSFSALAPVGRSVVIDATFDDSDDRLQGSFTQGDLAFTIDLLRSENYAYRDLPRPQLPKPPFEYRSRELVASHPDGHSLAGTLTLPDPGRFGPGPYPAAVLISGGGREDRDSTALGHKPFLVIADYLTRHGIAVMRFDDRGVGASEVNDDTPVGKDATSRQNATDTLAVVRHLRTVDEIDPRRIGLIGHSEGGMIAPMVHQMDRDIAFLVLLAAPGVRGDALFRKQMELDWEDRSVSASKIADASKRLATFQKLVIEQTSAEELDQAKHELAKMIVDAGLLADTKDRNDALDTANRALDDFDSPWWRFVFAYDPAPALAAAECPVLVLNGTKDRQVWHEQNLDAIVRVIQEAGGDVTARRYADLNHLFQPSKTGSPAEYAQIEITFDERVLRDIVEWILRKVVN